MKKISLIATALALSLLLCSCDVSPLDYIYSILGIDNTDYYAEEVISLPDADSIEIKRLAETARILAYGDEIITFDNFGSVKEKYLDIVLNYLGGEFYAKYSADTEMMDKLSEFYPELTVNTLIPRDDYENTVYTYFGGSRRAAVASSTTYSYLDKIDAFLLTGTVDQPEVSCHVVYAEETEHTYRLDLYFFEGGERSKDYEVVFMKRESGEAYIYRVSESNIIIAG